MPSLETLLGLFNCIENFIEKLSMWHLVLKSSYWSKVFFFLVAGRKKSDFDNQLLADSIVGRSPLKMERFGFRWYSRYSNSTPPSLATWHNFIQQVSAAFLYPLFSLQRRIKTQIASQLHKAMLKLLST